MKVKTCDLKLADVVRLGSGSFMDATVSNVTEKEVTFTRPYIHSGDFSYSGGVLTYIGQEVFSVYRDSNREYEVLQRKDLA